MLLGAVHMTERSARDSLRAKTDYKYFKKFDKSDDNIHLYFINWEICL